MMCFHGSDQALSCIFDAFIPEDSVLQTRLHFCRQIRPRKLQPARAARNFHKTI
jgi:hypothetical protein